MQNEQSISKEQLKDFLETVAAGGAAFKITQEGIQYVDRASFWQWMKDSYPTMFEKGVEKWMGRHPEQAERLLRGKGLEWDVFRTYHPHVVDLNRLSETTTDRVKDLTSYNPLTGESTPIQVKTSLSEGGIRQAAQQLFSYPPETKFAVNQSVYEEAVKQGMPPERFVKVVPDEEVRAAAEQRYQDAVGGDIEVGVSVGGVLKEAGKGALIGAVLYVGVSAISHYKAYKAGQISFEDFAKRLAKDGSKGGIIGGSMAVINVGVQCTTTALGVGAPVTIPVMLIISVGLKKIIDPMFRDGEYAETLRHLKYYDSLQKGWLHFGHLSVELFDAQQKLLEQIHIRSQRARMLNQASAAIDRQLDKELEDL